MAGGNGGAACTGRSARAGKVAGAADEPRGGCREDAATRGSQRGGAATADTIRQVESRMQEMVDQLAAESSGYG